jgi:catechol 2,3-dioxygenase-like lactoylglutathione lyase family enzyme
MSSPEGMVSVRYMVDDVDKAVDFYTSHLGFELHFSAAPAFADVTRGNLRLLLAGPQSSAGRPMPDGVKPGPGGWNRIHLIVPDIAAEVARLRGEGVSFRNEETDPNRGPCWQRRRALRACRRLVSGGGRGSARSSRSR